MARAETAFLDDILTLASAGQMDAVVQTAQEHAGWLMQRAPSPRGSEPYGRLPLHRDARGELMLAGWRAHQRCAPHDHGAASGIVIVIAGSFTETHYAASADGLRAADETTWPEGSAARVRAGLIHDMRCDVAGATLHVYLPAIARMRVYDFARRCTWTVDDDAGAWIPCDDRHVLAIEAWSSDSR